LILEQSLIGSLVVVVVDVVVLVIVVCVEVDELVVCGITIVSHSFAVALKNCVYKH
jgi:hypothetical protein